MRKLPTWAAALALFPFNLLADSSPALQWVKTVGGSGVNTVVGAASDAKGNLYIVGNTTSLDFPATAAAQRTPGGSTLVRINTASGFSDKLFPPGLSTATSIAADPRNPQTLYATASNAVWRSSDTGGTWSLLYQFASVATVNFVAVDPVNGNTLYACASPLGLFKSTDDGLTFAALNPGQFPSSTGAAFASRIWVDPNSPQVVFASTSGGLLRSPDAGASWTVATNFFYSNNTVVFDPFHPGTMYLAGGSNISRSTDDGQTFTNISLLPDQTVPLAMIADPLHAGVLFVGAYSGLYQSTDAGLTWTQKSTASTSLLAADPINPALYATGPQFGMVKSLDGFTTSSPIGPPETLLQQVLAAGPDLFLVAYPSYDVFAVKLDPNGNTVYSTYFGGSANDTAVSMALGADGSIYVTGATTSIDLPVTAGAYLATNATGAADFVFKLNPDGSLGWSTYFANNSNVVYAIGADSAGSPYVAGRSVGNLPTTPGAYQTQFQTVCIPTGLIGCLPGLTAAFVTKFNPQGTGLVYSTYVPTDNHKTTTQIAQAVAIDSAGNAWFGGYGNVVELNTTGTAVLAAIQQTGLNISAIALDANSNVYATGMWPTTGAFPATPGAFQPAPQPALSSLPGQPMPGGGTDAFVAKWDSGLTQLLAATLLGGESTDVGESIALDASGAVIVSGYTDSKSFPLHAPFQTSFAARTGFLAGLDASLTHLLFSTYLGDYRPFDAHAAVPDGNGNILLAGSTLGAAGPFIGSDPGASFTAGSLVVANKIALPPTPAARLDSVVNFASRMAAPLAPGETIAAIGAGFGPDAQLVVDGVPLAGSTLVGVLPDTARTSGAYQIQVSTGGTLSNPVYVPAAPASPGIFSVDGSGHGQGYILNSDGTLNSQSNPAAPGSAVTIFATGAGAFTLSGGYAVASQPPAVFIDGFYANGIASIVGPVAGVPGNVYQIGVLVPDPAALANQNPNLQNFKMPPQVGVKLIMGPVNPLNSDNSTQISQPGLFLSVKQ